MSVRQKIIPTRPGMGRGLINHDDRSRDFRALDLIRGKTADATKPRDRHWRRGGPYDQDGTSECVPNTGKGILNTAPLSSIVKYSVRSSYNVHEFYTGAQIYDEWEGEDYDGTSALGLCRYLKQRRVIQQYSWCFGLEDVLLTLSHIGPVGIGIWWYTDMFNPNSDGLIRVGGMPEGGHEVELVGVDVSEKVVIGMNSWGEEWGDEGMFKLGWNDLDRLLHEDGDAVIITMV